MFVLFCFLSFLNKAMMLAENFIKIIVSITADLNCYQKIDFKA